MSVTGCFLVLFILFHMAMNLTAIISPEAYNAVCEFLGANWYALAGTVVLALGVLIHFIYAIVLTLNNYRARGTQRYAVTVQEPGVAWASKNMLVLGVIILLGMGLHLYNFWAKMQLVEIMGNKAGWLTLYAGLAGGADVILLPEIPYDIKKVAQAVEARAKSKKPFSIIAVAEGAMSEEEAKMKKKEREAYRATLPYDCISKRIAAQLSEMVGVEARHVVPGHIQRGGSPSAYDRVLSTQFGVHAAQLIRDEIYGVTVALDGNEIIHNKLKDIAGVPKPVPKDDHVLTTARNMGICMGD